MYGGKGENIFRGEGQTKISKIYGRQRKGVGEGTTIFREGGWGRGGGGGGELPPLPPPKKIPCMVGMNKLLLT